MSSRPERKAFALKLDAPPDDEGRFTGYAAVFGNVDHGNDLIEPGAFTKTLQENPEVPILWSHDTDEPIGISTAMVEDGRGLKVEAQLAMDVQRAREVHALMKMGAIKGLSIGYKTVKRSFKGQVRHLQELSLGEFSPVVFGMNGLALIDGVKRAEAKDLYGYEATEGVACLLAMIRYGADFMVEEVAEGDTADAGRMQSILGSLTKLLASELAEVAAEGATDDPAQAPEVLFDEGMRSSIEHAVKNLEALLEFQPADPVTGTKEAASQGAEPEDSTHVAEIAGRVFADLFKTN